MIAVHVPRDKEPVLDESPWLEQFQQGHVIAGTSQRGGVGACLSWAGACNHSGFAPEALRCAAVESPGRAARLRGKRCRRSPAGLEIVVCLAAAGCGRALCWVAWPGPAAAFIFRLLLSLSLSIPDSLTSGRASCRGGCHCQRAFHRRARANWPCRRSSLFQTGWRRVPGRSARRTAGGGQAHAHAHAHESAPHVTCMKASSSCG